MSTKPPILFVSRKWPPAMGGMETYSVKLTEELAVDHHVRKLVLPGRPDGSAPGPLALVRFGALSGLRILFGMQSAMVVHAGDMAIWPMVALARLRHPSARRLISAHGTDVAYPARGGFLGRLYAAYLRIGAKLSGPVTVVANSAATAKEAQKYGFENTVVVPLAAEVPVIRAERDEGDRTILFSGRLTPRKGCRWFVEHVLPLLPDDMSLDVAGTVWDESEKNVLDAPQVRFLGKLDQETLWQRMAEAMCVVVPNIELDNGEFEGFGLVATEAAAAGGVVIGARHAGLVEAMKEGETGLLVTPGDAEAWAEAILEVADWSADRREAFTRKAREVSATHFNWSRVAADTARLYRTES